MKKKMYVSQFDNPYLQENFKTLVELANETPFLKGQWSFLTFSINTTGTAIKIPHTLKYTPLDTILLSVIGGSVTFNYTNFDGTYISIDATVTSSPMTVRMLLGRYSEDTLNV